MQTSSTDLHSFADGDAHPQRNLKLKSLVEKAFTALFYVFLAYAGWAMTPMMIQFITGLLDGRFPAQ